LKVILFFFSFNHVADKSLEVKPYQEKQKVFGMIYCFEPHEEEEEAEKENEFRVLFAEKISPTNYYF